MKSLRLVAAMIGIGLTAAAARAQPVDQRHVNQQQRIAQGIRSGALTPGEAHRIERQQRSIRQQEARMRDRDGGRLTRGDRAVLERREDRASRRIHEAKHNRRHW